MHHLKFFIVLILLIFTACDTTEVTTPSEHEPELNFEYRGGLSTDFLSDQATFKGNARLTQLSEQSGRIDIQLNAQSESENQREQANLIFRIIFDSDNGLLPEGNYIINSDDQTINIGECEYRLLKSNNDYSNYQFDGTSISLKIIQSTSNRISGSFIFYLDQSTGQRMIDGQLEDLTLSSPTQVLGKFDLKINKY